MALTATLYGANGCVDVKRFDNSTIGWCRRFRILEHGVPSHDTFGRVFARLDTSKFLSAMHSWVDSFVEGQRVAIGGKTLSGSIGRAGGTAALPTITAFAMETRTVLRQMSVDGQTNQIPAVPTLQELIALSGNVVTDGYHALPGRNHSGHR